MSYTSAKHQANRIAAAYGYKIAEGVSLDEFQVGDGVIILNKKGEPMMSGPIEDIQETDAGKQVVVGDRVWSDVDYMFRRM